MPTVRTADVIVTIDRNTPETLACLESVLRYSGPVLNRLIVVAQASLGPDLGRVVENLAQGNSRLTIIRIANSLGDVDTCNQGLRQRQGDAVILDANSRVTEGWLSELAAVAHSGGTHSVRLAALEPR